MKKQYISPYITIMNIQPMTIIAASVNDIGVSTDELGAGDDQFSRQGGSLWGDDDYEEDF